MKKIFWIVSAFTLLTMTAFAKPLGNGPLKWEVNNDTLFIDDFTISFQRTLRIPVDGKQYPLPPGLGKLPLYRVEDYASKLPKEWVEQGGVFMPMYQREAMWISFGGENWRPRAVKIGVGKINVLTGDPWTPDLKQQKDQDYLVAPKPQPWIDGIKAGKDFIRQFIAMPLGKGVTVEGQITGKETEGGLQITLYDPKKGIFKKPAPSRAKKEGAGFGKSYKMMAPSAAPVEATQMGLGAGGKMRQKIYPDPYGFNTWYLKKFGTLYVHIVNSTQFEKITGQKPPDTPITKKDYVLYNYPWFDLYDEKYADINASEKLKKIEPVKEKKEESIKVKKTIKYKMPKEKL